MTKSAKIRKLLAKNLSAGEIAKRLKIDANYVHTIKWLDKKNKKQTPVYKKATFKSPRSRLINDLFQMKKAMDKVEEESSVAKVLGDKVEVGTTIGGLTLIESAPKTYRWIRKDLVDKKAIPDLVNNPPHYTDGGVDTLKFIEAKDLNYRLGNVVKYISRAGKKVGSDPVQDLEKARFYLEREIEARRDA